MEGQATAGGVIRRSRTYGIGELMPNHPLQLTVLEVEPGSSPRAGDIHLRIEVHTCGFTGAVNAWVEGGAMDEFVCALTRLYDRLEGEARLESMSPGAFSLYVHREGPRGQIRVEGRIATWSGEPGWRRHRRDLALEFTELLEFEAVGALGREIRAQVLKCDQMLVRANSGAQVDTGHAVPAEQRQARQAAADVPREVSDARGRLGKRDYLASVRQFLAEASLRPEMYFNSLEELESVLHGHWVGYAELLGLGRDTAFNSSFAHWLWTTRRWSGSAGWARGMGNASGLEYSARRDIFFRLAIDFLDTLNDGRVAPTDEALP